MSRHDYNSYRPRYDRGSPPRPPAEARNAMYHFGRPSRGRGGRGDFSFRSRIAERDLLTHRPSAQEDVVFTHNGGVDKFKDVDNVTDSEEESMQEETDDEDDARGKRRRLNNGEATKPRWSNPDPYTALPPVPGSTGKHVDVVKLIRKARNDQSSPHTLAAEQDDFISFDNLDDETFSPPANAPTGPKADVVGNPPSKQDPVLGKRKRGDDNSRLMGARGRSQFHANGMVLADWKPSQDISPTPWLRPPKVTDSAMVALHKEIVDFYAWVKPHDFEGIVRENVISRLNNLLRRWGNGQLKSFGSYAAGLYLPTGDMDLVYNMGNVSTMSRSKMWQLGRFLEHNQLAAPGSVNVIAGAKVPIIKFVDSTTGLKVDLSFNNDTGIVAISTFEKWKAAHPALSIIVAVIKQFLMIRGLNDNSVGGIGGFASICLVASLIQNLPVVKAHNLGELLVEFFNTYGNLFDINTVGIRLEPPGYIDKQNYRLLLNEKPDRLMIVDPNRPDNNITGGSTEVPRIFRLFSQIHDQLLSRLDDFAAQDESMTNFSFLEAVIGGDFTPYYDQRKALYMVYQQMHPKGGKNISQQGIPPPPPPPSIQVLPLPPDGDTKNVKLNKNDDESSDGDQQATGGIKTKSEKPSSKSARLFERLEKLCPELIPRLGKKSQFDISKALKVGGWVDRKHMLKVLEKKERSVSKRALRKKSK
ncbi:hypothetical protein LTR64_001677 [Lithohypha guttulata]|uniref:uncharacterized protein n=1 Tax=Lithohypha guttulata TaxID=1690604 RepID=UPI002DDE5575|nr:hypothetical protein LTR51_003871 [Lithohypha guttulata]